MKSHLLLLLLLPLLYSCETKEPHIYEWRGEGRRGIYPDQNLLTEWPENGPVERWSLDGIGNGYGSPVFTEERFFITGEIDSLAILSCFDLDCRPVWQQTLGHEWIKSFPGSRSAPTIVDSLIYVGTGMGNLYCVERESGKIVWSKEFEKDFRGVYPFHGHSEAAVVSGDRVFWTPGGKEHNVVALNRFSGKLIWSHRGYGEWSGYNPGNLIILADRNIFVTFSAYHLMGFDTETGEMLWSHEQDSYPIEERKPGYGDTHANAILYENGSIYYVAGDGNCGVRLDLSSEGTTIEEVWQNKGFDGFMGGVIKIDNTLFSTGTSTRYFKSVNAATGQLIDSLKIGHGAVISADGMIYYYNQRGQMKLISNNQGKLQEISSFDITRGTGHHFSHPVIHEGVLYQRHGQALMSFDLRHEEVLND